MDDGRDKILRNVDNYQSRRRNVSENLNLNFYLLLLPFRNAFEVCQFLEGNLYCFCLILCCILVTRLELQLSHVSLLLLLDLSHYKRLIQFQYSYPWNFCFRHRN